MVASPSSLPSIYPLHCNHHTPSNPRRNSFSQKENLCRNAKLVIIPQSDLRKMQRCRDFQTLKEAKATQKIKQLERQKLKQKAQAHIDRLIRIDKNRHQNKNALDKEMAREKEDRIRELKKKLKDFRCEHIDEVKIMEQMAKSAQCVTVRDKQLALRCKIREGQREEMKKLDLMVEIDRIRAVDKLQRMEKEKKQEEIKGRHKIVEQIQQNYLKRLKLKEDQQEEAKEVLKHIKGLKVKAQQEQKIKLMKQEKLKMDIDLANRQAIRIKREKLEEVKLENVKIMKYLKEKQRKEEEYYRLKLEEQDEKEREVARLREKQERAQDRQQELDYIRARRAFQKVERAAREKAKFLAQKQERLNNELNHERHHQIGQKRKSLQNKMQVNQNLHDMAMNKVKSEMDRERSNEERRRQDRLRHAEELKKQIAARTELRYQTMRDKREERKRILKVRLFLRKLI